MIEASRKSDQRFGRNRLLMFANAAANLEGLFTPVEAAEGSPCTDGIIFRSRYFHENDRIRIWPVPREGRVSKQGEHYTLTQDRKIAAASGSRSIISTTSSKIAICRRQNSDVGL